jgi:glycosyltransferase involved in cell wall biosynthesis
MFRREKRFGGSVEHRGSAGSAAKERALTSVLRQQLNPFIDLLRYRIEPQLIAWLDEFRPEIVYSCFSNLRITRLVEFVASRFGAPVVPHIMDDWWHAPYYRAWAAPLIGPFLRRSFLRILPKAPAILTIGEDMKEEYQRRFGIPCRHYMNCLEDKWIDAWGKKREPCDGLSVAVIGNLDHGRAFLLADLAKALTMAGQSLGIQKVALNIYSYTDARQIQQAVRGFDMVSLHQPPADEDLAMLFGKNNIMAHLEDFAGVDCRYYRFSLTGKLPVYLASGRPILVYGPESGGTARFLRRKSCGKVVGRRDINELASMIQCLAADNRQRDEVVSQAGRVLNQEFRQSAVAGSFQRTLAGFATRS